MCGSAGLALALAGSLACGLVLLSGLRLRDLLVDRKTFRYIKFFDTIGGIARRRRGNVRPTE